MKLLNSGVKFHIIRIKNSQNQIDYYPKLIILIFQYRCGSLCLINHLEKIHEDQIREERIGNTNIKIESSENNPDVQEVITIINNSNPKNTPRPLIHPNPNYNNQNDIDAPIQIVKKMRKRSRPTNTNPELVNQEDSKENILVRICDDSPRLKSRKLQINNGTLYPTSLPVAPKIEPNSMHSELKFQKSPFFFFFGQKYIF